MAKQKATTVELKQLDIKRIKIHINGITPLIVHRFGEKAKKQMLDKQMGKTTLKEKKDPTEQYESCFYRLDDGDFGFPADAFKMSMLRGSKALGMVMTDNKSAFFVCGEYSKQDGRELVRIQGTVEQRIDTVQLQTGVADIRFRPQFKDWSAVLVIEFNAGIITPEQIVNIINSAGFGVGIGEWRPSSDKPGTFGRFSVGGVVNE